MSATRPLTATAVRANGIRRQPSASSALKVSVLRKGVEAPDTCKCYLPSDGGCIIGAGSKALMVWSIGPVICNRAGS